MSPLYSDFKRGKLHPLIPEKGGTDIRIEGQYNLD